MTLKPPSKEQLDNAAPSEIGEYLGPGLDRLSVGRLYPDVFVQLRRLVVMSTIEIVAFQAETEGERVLIGKRGAEAGDLWWAGKLNLPGSVIMPNEDLESEELFMADGQKVDIGQSVVSSDLTRPSDRILNTEFKASVSRTAPVSEFMRRWVKSESGTENKTWVWTEVEIADGHQAVQGGDFYDTQDIINDPPESLIRAHHYFIEQGALALRAARS